MTKRKRSARKILSIAVPLVFVLFAVFIFVYGIGNGDPAPDATAPPADTPAVAVEATPNDLTPEDTALNDPALLASEPPAGEPPPAEPDTPEYITLQLNTEDIYKGSLILVNSDHKYTFPIEDDIVEMGGKMSSSYRLHYESAKLSETAITPLNDMMDAFYEETGNQTVTIRSGHRSMGQQQWIYNDYVERLGQAEAKRYVSVPGHSEHHTGLAIDFGRKENGDNRTFSENGIYSWFRDNSYIYGFIKRFPEDKIDITKVLHEAWHYRYVGIPHAYIMYSNNWCLEEYLEMLCDYTAEKPLEVLYDGTSYEIFFTRETEIILPAGCEYDYSGNNIDGFIITIYPGKTVDS